MPNYANLPSMDTIPSSSLPPRLNEALPIVCAIQRISLPPPDTLTTTDLASAPLFEIWGGEVWSYLRVASFLGYSTMTVAQGRRPTGKWEAIAQAYVVRRLLSLDVKRMLVEREVDMEDLGKVMDGLDGLVKEREGWEAIEVVVEGV